MGGWPIFDTLYGFLMCVAHIYIMYGMLLCTSHFYAIYIYMMVYFGFDCLSWMFRCDLILMLNMSIQHVFR